MRKNWSILAGFLICAQVFLACSDSSSSSTSSSIIDDIEKPDNQETSKPNEPIETDTAAPKETVLPDSTTKPDTTAPEDTAKIDTTPQYAVFEDSCGLHFTLGENDITAGNLYLNYPADSFLTRFEVGDIATVAIVGYDTLEMPIAESTNDVPISWFLLAAVKGFNQLALSIHYGQLAEILGITAENAPIEVIVSMKEKGGYLLGIDIMRNTQYLDTYTENYPDLSIEDFANFREVQTTGMGENKLYRSSSPIYIYLGRNYYADSLAKEAGVATFINLTDSESSAYSYKGFETTYYSTQNAIFLAMPTEFFSTPFKEGLVKGFHYMIEHESPYLVHCTYGMDRTGFTIAVLEALMGATVEEIQADYAKTFSNYFTVVDSKQIALNEQQVDFFKSVVLRNLRAVYHAEGIEVPETDDADWVTATENYLEKLGMTPQEISELKDRLK